MLIFNCDLQKMSQNLFSVSLIRVTLWFLLWLALAWLKTIEAHYHYAWSKFDQNHQKYPHRFCVSYLWIRKKDQSLYSMCMLQNEIIPGNIPHPWNSNDDNTELFWPRKASNGSWTWHHFQHAFDVGPQCFKAKNSYYGCVQTSRISLRDSE